MESHSLTLDRNLLPSPSPWLAPFTKPAISTYSIVVGMIFSDFEIPLMTYKIFSKAKNYCGFFLLLEQ